MYNTIQDLLNAYQATPETLKTLLRNYSSQEIVASHAVEEEWSVVEIICHLRDTEEASLKRTRLMRDENHPKLTARDAAKLAIEQNYTSAPLDATLDAFLQFRATHLQELKDLTSEQWECAGEHIWAGQITIREQIAHLVAHDAIHLAQISRQLI